MFFGNTRSHFSSTDCDANTIRGPRLRRGRPKWPAHNWCQRWWLVVGGGFLASVLEFLLPIWEWPLSDSPSIDYGETPIRNTVCKSWLIIAMMGLDAHRRPVWLSQSLCIWSTNHTLQLRTPSPTATAATATSRWPRSKANAWLTHMAACRRCYLICSSCFAVLRPFVRHSRRPCQPPSTWLSALSPPSTRCRSKGSPTPSPIPPASGTLTSPVSVLCGGSQRSVDRCGHTVTAHPGRCPSRSTRTSSTRRGAWRITSTTTKHGDNDNDDD
ncbi:uncharacterized protein LOC122376902 [Amphibalanus amphitrite]|uniref:uncharacterized protein LOC122376902 n=1 Tax=Amphibalanus amphitrite TaxID=1232801 RepID=UPI001C905938|nr:uncharacterized protein LOC122376902 [Amphibalanus amphitrite]